LSGWGELISCPYLTKVINKYLVLPRYGTVRCEVRAAFVNFYGENDVSPGFKFLKQITACALSYFECPKNYPVIIDIERMFLLPL
jgi:hypothetical protein